MLDVISGEQAEQKMKNFGIAETEQIKQQRVFFAGYSL